MMCSYIKFFFHFKLVDSSTRDIVTCVEILMVQRNKNRRQSPSLSDRGTASIPPLTSLSPSSFPEGTMPRALKNSSLNRLCPYEHYT